MNRQAISFPDVAIIHKGSPKQRIERDGRTVEIQGKDLNQKFRLHFLPGTDDVRASWHAKHAGELKEYGPKYTIPSGYEFESVRVVVPAPSVWDAWDYGNEVYNAGRRIALANDEQYLTLRDPLTGAFLVKDGKPFKAFQPGDTITYKRNDKEYTLVMKSHGRLRLVLEDLVLAGHLVQVILKTTSYYDCQNINRQLAGIQALANSINGGNAGGIPLIIYRAEQEVAWNKKDGGAQRIKKWFINIKADPNWVKFAFAQLGKNALSGSGMNSLLLPPPALSGTVNPDSESFDSGDEEQDHGDAIEGEFNPPEEYAEPEAPPEQEQVVRGHMHQAEPVDDGEQGAPKYPYLGDVIVSMVAKRAGITKPEAAKWLGQAAKEGRIQKELTKADAIEFASRLNV